MTTLNEQSVRDAVSTLTDPEIGRTLGDLQMIQTVDITDGAARISVELPTPAYPEPERIREAIDQALREQSPEAETEVTFTSTTKGKDAGGTMGLRVKNIIAVGSGKGGVGKSHDRCRHRVRTQVLRRQRRPA